jgi:hypothetical protein
LKKLAPSTRLFRADAQLRDFRELHDLEGRFAGSILETSTP